MCDILLFLVTILVLGSTIKASWRDSDYLFEDDTNEDYSAKIPSGLTTCDNIIFDKNLPNHDNGTYETHENMNFETCIDKCESEYQSSKKCLSYIWLDEATCYLNRNSIQAINTYVTMIGGPKNCEAKIKTCGYFESECNMTTSPYRKLGFMIFGHKAKLQCQIECIVDPDCNFYTYYNSTYKCLLYSRPEKECSQRVGVPESAEKCNEDEPEQITSQISGSDKSTKTVSGSGESTKTVLGSRESSKKVSGSGDSTFTVSGSGDSTFTVSVPGVLLTCDNIIFDMIVPHENGIYETHEKTSFETCKDKCEVDYQSSKKCLSYIWDEEFICYLNRISVQAMNNFVTMIGSPKDCEAKIKNCGLYESECNMTTSPYRILGFMIFGHKAKLQCQIECIADPDCIFYTYYKATYKCLLYSRPEKECSQKVGVPKSAENCTEEGPTTNSSNSKSETTTYSPEVKSESTAQETKGYAEQTTYSTEAKSDSGLKTTSEPEPEESTSVDTGTTTNVIESTALVTKGYTGSERLTTDFVDSGLKTTSEPGTTTNVIESTALVTKGYTGSERLTTDFVDSGLKTTSEPDFIENTTMDPGSTESSSRSFPVPTSYSPEAKSEPKESTNDVSGSEGMITNFVEPEENTNVVTGIDIITNVPGIGTTTKEPGIDIITNVPGIGTTTKGPGIDIITNVPGIGTTTKGQVTGIVSMIISVPFGLTTQNGGGGLWSPWSQWSSEHCANNCGNVPRVRTRACLQTGSCVGSITDTSSTCKDTFPPCFVACLYSHDYTKQHMPIPTVNDCMAVCKQIPWCVSFSFSISKKYCYLKPTFNREILFSDDYITGTKC